MFVPQTKLLRWVAWVGLPGALFVALTPETAMVALSLMGGLAAAVLLDAALGVGALRGLTLEPAGLARLAKYRPGMLALRVRNPDKKARQFRLGLALPAEVLAAQEELLVNLPGGSEFSALSWPCTGYKRGQYWVRNAFLETASPLGFWGVRTVLPLRAEVRVYPDLLRERRHVSALFLRQGQLGIHAIRQVGKGRDFEQLREYVAGDSFDDIHWKATAKRGRPVTKVFQIERTQEIYVIVDGSRLTGRPTLAQDVLAEKAFPVAAHVLADFPASAASPARGLPEPLPNTVLERFVNAALVLSLAAERQGDLYGLAAFASQVRQFVRARNGKAHYGACRDALYALHPQIETPDFEEICSFIRVRLRRRALLFFLTELDDPVLAENFLKGVDLIRRQHLVFVHMLRPPQAFPLFTGQVVNTEDDIYQRLGGHIQWQRLAELEKELQRRGVHFSLLDHEKLCAQLVTQYLTIKRRQLL